MRDEYDGMSPVGWGEGIRSSEEDWGLSDEYDF